MTQFLQVRMVICKVLCVMQFTITYINILLRLTSTIILHTVFTSPPQPPSLLGRQELDNIPVREENIGHAARVSRLVGHLRHWFPRRHLVEQVRSTNQDNISWRIPEKCALD